MYSRKAFANQTWIHPAMLWPPSIQHWVFWEWMPLRKSSFKFDILNSQSNLSISTCNYKLDSPAIKITLTHIWSMIQIFSVYTVHKLHLKANLINLLNCKSLWGSTVVLSVTAACSSLPSSSADWLFRFVPSQVGTTQEKSPSAHWLTCHLAGRWCRRAVWRPGTRWKSLPSSWPWGQHGVCHRHRDWVLWTDGEKPQTAGL